MWLTANRNLYIQPKMGGKCQAHNLKVVGSDLTPATNFLNKINHLNDPQKFRFWMFLLYFLVFVSTNLTFTRI